MSAWTTEKPTTGLAIPLTRETKSVEEVLRRMLGKVEIVTESGCWIWPFSFLLNTGQVWPYSLLPDGP